MNLDTEPQFPSLKSARCADIASWTTVYMEKEQLALFVHPSSSPEDELTAVTNLQAKVRLSHWIQWKENDGLKAVPAADPDVR